MFNVYPESSNKFESSEAITNYIYGGRGIMKLQAPSGVHHYYMFQKPADRDAFPDDVVFVYAIHDFEKKFYIGMIEQGKFRLTRNSRFLPDTDIVKGAFYIMKMSKSQKLVDSTPMSLSHMGMCARCGRELKTDKSIQLGYGRKCAARMSTVFDSNSKVEQDKVIDNVENK